MSDYLNWRNINTVFLDLDGTLLDLHFDNHFWLEHVPLRYADIHGVPHDQARATLMGHYQRVRGTLNWYCVDFWTRELQMDIEQLKHEIAGKIAVRPDVEAFLAAVRNSGRRVVLVTNAHPASIELKMDRTGLHVYFDRMINAHDIGLAKEHDGFWQKMHTIEPFVSDDTLLIDDNIDVLKSAQRYGIAHLLAIHKPDSRKEPVAASDYRQLKSFSEITP